MGLPVTLFTKSHISNPLNFACIKDKFLVRYPVLTLYMSGQNNGSSTKEPEFWLSMISKGLT